MTSVAVSIVINLCAESKSINEIEVFGGRMRE